MAVELVIRRAEYRDAPKIAALEEDCFPDHPWTADMIRHEIEYNELVQVIVAESEGKILGYESAQFLLDECDLRRIAVAPEQRRQKLGTILLDALFRVAEEQGAQMITLEVDAENLAAIGLYQKEGFQVNGRRPDYYGKDKDALLMIRIGDPSEVHPEVQS
ncbi:MAG: ribosomal protein S18-alanine N-acetyltransferase [Eubacteriales bacterium]|nr:ribosomal protein S18-alanine N-acetyltransferase [Eubacteriales bacterium]